MRSVGNMAEGWTPRGRLNLTNPNNDYRLSHLGTPPTRISFLNFFQGASQKGQKCLLLDPAIFIIFIIILMYIKNIIIYIIIFVYICYVFFSFAVDQIGGVLAYFWGVLEGNIHQRLLDQPSGGVAHFWVFKSRLPQLGVPIAQTSFGAPHSCVAWLHSQAGTFSMEWGSPAGQPEVWPKTLWLCWIGECHPHNLFP